MGHWGLAEGRWDSIERSANVTPSATAHVKGAWAQIVAAAAIEVLELTVASGLPNVTAGISALVDIGVGGAGTEQVLIPNLYALDNNNNGANLYARAAERVEFPVSIPKGTRIAARAQASIASAGALAVDLILLGGGFQPTRPLGKVTEVGTDTANSRGTAVTSGVGVYGSWAQLVASTARTFHALAIEAGNPNNPTAAQSVTLDVGVGAAAAERVILTRIMWWHVRAGGGSNTTWTLGALPMLIPAGTRIAARIKAANADTIYVAGHGVS